jgi:predicted enzyme related to lactoylglutathione lyase
MGLTLRAITFDAHDPARLGEFWAAALGWIVETVRGEVAVEPSAEDPWDVHLLFLPVPEGKAAKNRCHPDLHTDDLDREVARLVGLGAVEVSRHSDFSRWAVLNDPEGNEFCVVQPGAGAAHHATPVAGDHEPHPGGG